MKKFLALTLTLCMVLSLLPVSAMAARLRDDAPVAEAALGDEAVTTKPAPAGKTLAEEDEETGTQAAAKIGETEYATLAEAVAAAEDGDTVKLLADVTVNETYSSGASLEIRKALTIDGQGQFTVTCGKKFGIRIFGVSEDEETMKVILKNVTVTNANALGRAVETRGGNVELELDNATLTTTGTGNTQVFTVGGNRANATTVTIQNGSKLIASQAGYGVITFNPVDMTVDNSEISGYGALYMKGPDSSAGSAGSVVNIVNGANVSSTGIAGSSNSFGTLVFQDNNITVNVVDSTVVAIADPSNDPATPQAIILFNSSYGDTEDAVVTISGSSCVNMVDENAAFVRNKTDEHTITISGGTFSDDVSEYMAEGCCWNESEGRVATHDCADYVSNGDATCTEDGAKTATCANCGETDTAPDEGSALGHDMQEVDGTAEAPTCTEPGKEADQGCSRCEYTETGAEIAATGHTMTVWGYDDNNHWHVCETCGEKDETDEPAAHVWALGTVSGGSRTDTCECGAERAVTVPTRRPTTTTTPAPTTPTEPEEDLDDPDVPLTELPLLFADVSASDWFYDAVKYISAKNIIQGTDSEGTKFSPSQNTTRGSVAAILHRLENTPDAGLSDFDDVLDGKWYTEAVSWTDANGLMIGFEDGTFRPEDNVTREQLVTVLYRYAKKLGRDVTAVADLSGFADVDSVSDWATDAMGWAVSTGLIRGRDGSALAPRGLTTRGELAIILQRFLEMK